jgi:hypothetical protein
MSFCTAINCMDGRVQAPVAAYLRRRFRARYVDVVSEPGPNGILASGKRRDLVRSIFDRVRISVGRHCSKGIAVVGHHDCAGNPVNEARQIEDLEKAVARVRAAFPALPVIGLWVDSRWRVEESPGRAACACRCGFSARESGRRRRASP